MRLRAAAVAMYFDVRRVALAACGALLLIGALGTAQAVAAGLPRSPIELGIGASGLKIKPSVISFTGDGTGALGGANPNVKRGIVWSSWTATTALGTGAEQLDYCVPTCAAGKIHDYPVKIEQWRPQMLGAATVFTRMTIWYSGVRPKGATAHFTFSNVYDAIHETYGWAPAARAGFCVDTHGAQRAAGCANISALP
jgi:hypothetical protein